MHTHTDPNMYSFIIVSKESLEIHHYKSSVLQIMAITLFINQYVLLNSSDNRSHQGRYSFLTRFMTFWSAISLWNYWLSSQVQIMELYCKFNTIGEKNSWVLVNRLTWDPQDVWTGKELSLTTWNWTLEPAW